MEDFQLLDFYSGPFEMQAHRSDNLQQSHARGDASKTLRQPPRVSPSVQGPKVTVIIGPNGSGKSGLLGRVTDEFDRIDQLRREATGNRQLELGIKEGLDARLSYRLNGQICEIRRFGGNVEASVNAERAFIDAMPFPSKVLAVAHLPVDRFRFAGTDASSFYSYLGLRQATNLTTTGALESKVLLSLLRGYTRVGFHLRVTNWLSLLGLAGPATIQFGRIKKQLLRANTFAEFEKIVRDEFARRNTSSRRIPNQDPLRGLEHALDESWVFFKLIQPFTTGAQGSFATARVQVADSLWSSSTGPEVWARGVESARRLRLLPEVSLEFIRDQEQVRFSDLSSGEQQVLGTTTRLLAELEPYSLVAIDEPEVSLHPAWQVRYIPTLIETLRGFPSTHILVATHSHFLVADADEAQVDLMVGRTRTREGKFHFASFDGDVYGRSAENILYRVFGVAAIGNFYVEQDLAAALQMVSGVTEFSREKLISTVQRLKRVQQPDNEAMAQIIEEVDSFLRRVG